MPLDWLLQPQQPQKPQKFGAVDVDYWPAEYDLEADLGADDVRGRYPEGTLVLVLGSEADLASAWQWQVSTHTLNGGRYWAVYVRRRLVKAVHDRRWCSCARCQPHGHGPRVVFRVSGVSYRDVGGATSGCLCHWKRT